jgi:twinkle protein
MDEASFLQKEPCPQCGSRDNLARYTDGHGFCFGCGHYEPGDRQAEDAHPKTKGTPRMTSEKPLVEVEKYDALTKRRITQETAEKWGYGSGTFKDQKVQIANYKDATGRTVAQKLRFKNKDFLTRGEFDAGLLYGAWLWRDAGKRIVITEGELDALSVSQVQNNSWPVVSVPTGAQGAKKSLSKNLDWLSKFEEVVLMFDQDEPGQEAAAECALLFKPGQCKIAHLPLKDASEMLVAGQGKELRSAIYDAKVWRPDGIVSVGEVRDAALKPLEMGLPWCIEGLSDVTYGRRFGEAYALGAGTGIGKTDLTLQQVEFDVIKLEQKVATFFLEQQPSETVRRLAGKYAGKQFMVPPDVGGWTEDEIVQAIDALDGCGRLYMYDHFGTTDWEKISHTMRCLAHGEGVRIFYIDHLTALATGIEGLNEKDALEKITADIGAMVKELDVMIFFISHLATPDGTPHEEGGRVTIRHFKGSRAIGYWSHFMFGLERNQQADDPEEASTTILRVLKDRHTGQATGKVFYLGYDPETGRLFEREDNPFKTDDAEDDDAPF